MKSLEQWNKERKRYYPGPGYNKPMLNGIECPECGLELFDSEPALELTSYPPKKTIHCKCGFRGFRIV